MTNMPVGGGDGSGEQALGEKDGPKSLFTPLKNSCSCFPLPCMGVSLTTEEEEHRNFELLLYRRTVWSCT